MLAFLPLLALGVLQGFTEFFPVSSSGHVATLALFMPVKNMSLALVIALHIGTLSATLVVFRKDITSIFTKISELLRGKPKAPDELISLELLIAITLASLATALVGMMLKSHVEQWMHEPQTLGLCFCLTATTLFALRAKKKGTRKLSWQYALWIGIAQGLAVTPGISRSGSTIACAMFLGVPAVEAFRFSFLISIPAILGATLLEGLGASPERLFSHDALIGALIAFISGYIALLLLRRILIQGHFWGFSLYLFPLGVFLIWWGSNLS
ncbi:MAG: undecaprenyl-diphosphate phosphatase [Myxococcales bacterium]|nr:MAG: undecaprenyl-diphosphate phosphatase [Myxococcales bacterium]